MALQMSRPYKHPKTGVYYFRQRVPTDLRPLLGDKIVSWSLLTKVPDEAKVRNAAAVQEQAMIWERHRKRPEPLPHAQIVALSGIFYRSFMASLEMEPGEPTIWIALQNLLDRVAAGPDGLEEWYGPEVDKLLLEEGIVTDDYSRSRLLQELDRALRQAAEQQLKRAEGDYSPDPKAGRFPSLAAASAVPKKVAPEGLTIRALFAMWERDHLANGNSARTVGDFRQKIESLVSFVGHDDALRVAAFVGHDDAEAVTEANVSDWTDHLRHKEGLAAKTVGQKYLAAVKAIYGLARQKRKITVNPAEVIKARASKTIRTRQKGFTDEEAKAILTCALRDPATSGGMAEGNKLAIRWVPWIGAYTGARVTEITQLRKVDLVTEQGIPCIRITPDAGSVKTGRYRLVPVHPHLLEMGLEALFKDAATDHLFFALKGSEADTATRARAVSGKVSEWVRNVAKVEDPKVQPTHGWRHRFKTVGREVGIEQGCLDALQGHEDGRAASG